jgi:hypothetical protein
VLGRCFVISSLFADVPKYHRFLIICSRNTASRDGGTANEEGPVKMTSPAGKQFCEVLPTPTFPDRKARLLPSEMVFGGIANGCNYW